MTTNKNQIYDAIDVAEYCLFYCSQIIKTPISNLQLQKILYYIQAKFLVEKNKPCFNDEIVAWRYGPVIEEVYSVFKYHSSDVIELTEEANIIDNTDKNIMNEICDIKSKYDAFTLVRMTHKEEPWSETAINDVISTAKIKDYFIINQDKLTI